MRATRFEAFGDPSVLKVAEVPAPTADEKGRVGAGDRGFDQSERREERRRGDEPDKSAAHPGRSGRGWSGRVIGVEVWGTSDDTGFTRDGTHAELIAVPVTSLRRKPKTRSFRIGRDGRPELYGRLVGIEAAALKSGDRALDRRWRRCRQRRRPDRSTSWRPRDRSGQARAGSQRANSRHS